MKEQHIELPPKLVSLSEKAIDSIGYKICFSAKFSEHEITRVVKDPYWTGQTLGRQ